MSSRQVTDTTVGIVGSGPAGLMLAHLLHRAGVDTVAIDIRTREEIETTHRAGILEHDSVRLLVDSGVSDRVLREGHRHEGIDLRFGGVSHRIDFDELVGASVWLYPQTDVFIDLADARDRDGGDVRFGVADTAVSLAESRPAVHFTDAEGTPCTVSCDLVVGADGSGSTTRQLVEERQQDFREYPFAWFGILCAAPPSAPELVYTRSERGFALISQRTDEIQRMYFQCDPGEDADSWPDHRIWNELQLRVAGEDGFVLQEGRVLERTVLPFRSFVCTPMRQGPLLLAGDAAHTVPPTGAKGLNLALADVRVLAEEIQSHLAGDERALDRFPDRALARVWKAQHFSYWMTTMLHRQPESSDFDERRQRGELEALVSSQHGAAYLAEAYTGWPGE